MIARMAVAVIALLALADVVHADLISCARLAQQGDFQACMNCAISLSWRVRESSLGCTQWYHSKSASVPTPSHPKRIARSRPGNHRVDAPEMQRSLFAGSESKLTSYAWLKPDCSTTVANVNVVTQPKKGTVRFEEAPDVVLASKSPIEKQCHGKPIRATHVYYSADKDALGTDRLVFDVDTKLGFIYRSTLLVNVEKPKPSATSAEASAGPKPFAEIRQSLPERRLLRSVLANSEARIAAMNYVNTDCTSGPLPSLRIVTEPKNGAYRLEETVIPVDRAAANSRSVCNGKPVSAIAVFYKPNAEYTGTDDMVIDTDYHDGNVSRFVYAITVR